MSILNLFPAAQGAAPVVHTHTPADCHITSGTTEPTGGQDGDIYLQYEAQA